MQGGFPLPSSPLVFSILDLEGSRSQRQGSEFLKGGELCEVVSRCLLRHWCLAYSI